MAFVDSRTLQPGFRITSDVCVIGGGAAGITLALTLQQRGLSVALLESGGLSADAATLDLYNGENVGLPYAFAGGCRSRYLGGSSNCWGGWCRPWSPFDFTRREWVPHSGWPIGFDDLAPHYDEAMRLLKVGRHGFDPAFWEQAIGRPDVRRLPLDDARIVDSVSHFSPPVRFGIDYREDLERSTRITVYLWSNVVDIATSAEGTTVDHLAVRTLSGRSGEARARHYVLATGGIENARLLLASNRQSPAGVGNAHDLVGRYFMDHPRLSFGSVRFLDPYRRNKLYDTKFHYQNDAVGALGVRIASAFTLTPEIQRAEGLLSSRAWFRSIFPGEMTEATQALFRMKRRLARMDEAGHTFGGDLLKILSHPLDSTMFVAARTMHLNFLISDVKIEAIVEPEPDPDSRVTLSTERDALGLPRARVDWKLAPSVKRTFDRTFALLGESLVSRGIAQVLPDPPLESRDWPDSLAGTWHHMGTTRMHESPRQGVVDPDCRVHGMHNLFVAGSSVFPTAAANFPTITLVALAVRLAGHIGDLARTAPPETRIAASSVEAHE